jgi:YesN/AraC family two-component response regulator
VVSSYDDYEYVRETFLHKIEDYLLKPVQPLKFKKILEHIEEKLVNCSTDSFSVEKESVKQRAVKTSTENLILEIENYLKEHLEEDNSMVKICKKFNISQPYLSKIFKKYKRCTYNDFLNQLKIEKAKKLLEEREDLLIGSIATLSGYTDQFYFSKVFKGNVGVTPTEFRKQLAESFSL